MKGAFVLADDRRLFDQIAQVVVARGGTVWERSAQEVDVDTGLLVTVDELTDAQLDVERRQGVDAVRAGGHEALDLGRSDVTACMVECRSEHVFVSWVRRIADARPAGSTWVLDGDGVLWATSELDAAEVRL